MEMNLDSEKFFLYYDHENETMIVSSIIEKNKNFNIILISFDLL